MPAPAFIGDELTATGFALAGLDVFVPEANALAAVFRTALAERELVLITADRAAELPRNDLEAALGATTPMVVVVPDLRGRTNPPDLAGRVYAALGVEQ